MEISQNDLLMDLLWESRCQKLLISFKEMEEENGSEKVDFDSAVQGRRGCQMDAIYMRLEE